MPFKKIEDYNLKDTCIDPEHNPPGNIVLEPGVYEYTCPSCGKVTRISVPRITC